MSDEAKKGRGRPSRWGAGNSNKQAIAADLKGVAAGDDSVSMYYVQKLVEMGLVEIRLTADGEKYVGDNA